MNPGLLHIISLSLIRLSRLQATGTGSSIGCCSCWSPTGWSDPKAVIFSALIPRLQTAGAAIHRQNVALCSLGRTISLPSNNVSCIFLCYLFLDLVRTAKHFHIHSQTSGVLRQVPQRTSSVYATCFLFYFHLPDF